MSRFSLDELETMCRQFGPSEILVLVVKHLREQAAEIAELKADMGCLKADMPGIFEGVYPTKCDHGVMDGEWCEQCNAAMKQAIVDNAESLGGNNGTPLTCANCGEVSTNVGQFADGRRWVCTEACRKELASNQSHDDLTASGGIVDAP